jgi:uncharacterized repeat protein (TIGR03803 family)
LALRDEIGDPRGVSESIELVAGVAVAERKRPVAAQLRCATMMAIRVFGSEAHRKETPMPSSSKVAIVLLSLSAMSIPVSVATASVPRKSVLFAFVNNGPAGATPRTTQLILSGNGNLFGTTSQGGDLDNGTVFEMFPPRKTGAKWTEKVVASMSGQRKDGAEPSGLAAYAGSFYGTTSCCGPKGDGTVFKLTPPRAGRGGWTEQIIHQFTRGVKGVVDGSSPTGQMAFDKNGDIFGVTVYGGASNVSFGNGVVYELQAPRSKKGTWLEKLIYVFKGKPDGANPMGGLTMAADGSLYGTTNLGGASNNGTVFRLTKPASSNTTWKEQILYSFRGGADGAQPRDNRVILDRVGNVYGMAYEGGANGNGVVYELKRSKGRTWPESVLYRFHSRDSAVVGPEGGLTMGSKGILYGTTSGGGGDEWGTVFELLPSNRGGKWNEQDLWTFDGGVHYGGAPEAGVTLGRSGSLYGTVSREGPGGCQTRCGNGAGEVFKFNLK